MTLYSAFVPSAPLRPARATSALSSRMRPNPRRAACPPRVTRMSGDLPDFDEIAKQLSAELQSRSVPTGETPPMPPTDAPTDQQPIHITTGPNNMPKIVLQHAPSMQSLELFLYGAAVTSWKTRDEDHFWLSDTNKFEPGGKAIRGGIPICFPQFGPYGDLQQHGFARVSDWRIRETFVAEDSSVSAVLSLNTVTGGDSVADWPYRFDAEYMVTLSALGLETKLTVRNLDEKPIPFTCAFHNYFSVSSVDNARVFGFENIPYLDRLQQDKEVPGDDDSGAGFLLTEETDRIYPSTPDELAIFDFGKMKVIKIKKTPTLPDATLWNPHGAEGADPGWNNFVCIEPASIKTPTVVAPNETWVGAQLLGVE